MSGNGNGIVGGCIGWWGSRSAGVGRWWLELGIGGLEMLMRKGGFGGDD